MRCVILGGKTRPGCDPIAARTVDAGRDSSPSRMLTINGTRAPPSVGSVGADEANLAALAGTRSS